MLKRGEVDRRIMSFQDQKRSPSLSASFQSLLLEILQLYRFAKLNYSGFLCLFMQHDSASDSDLRRVVLHKPFWTDAVEYHKLAMDANFLFLTSSLVSPYHRISTFFKNIETDSHVALPQQQQANINKHAPKSPSACSPWPCSVRSCETTPTSDMCLKPPSAQQGQQHRTYWMHPSNMLEIMLYLSNKMVLAQEGAAFRAPAANEIGSSDRQRAWDHQYKMTTLYMDTPQLSGYTQRLQNSKQPTSMSRVRWYDSISSLDSAGSPRASVEQTVYGASSTEQVQQRVWLKSKHIQPWLSGSFSLGSIWSKASCQYHVDGSPVSSDDAIHEMKDACLLMEQQVHTRQLQPGKTKASFLPMHCTHAPATTQCLK